MLCPAAVRVNTGQLKGPSKGRGGKQNVQIGQTKYELSTKSAGFEESVCFLQRLVPLVQSPKFALLLPRLPSGTPKSLYSKTGVEASFARGERADILFFGVSQAMIAILEEFRRVFSNRWHKNLETILNRVDSC